MAMRPFPSGEGTGLPAIPEPGQFQVESPAGQDAAFAPAGGEPSGESSSRWWRLTAVNVIGYVLSAVLGLGIGYLVVSWLWPDLKFW
jgi:hypothetical protein